MNREVQIQNELWQRFTLMYLVQSEILALLFKNHSKSCTISLPASAFFLKTKKPE
jgi:hypothetical protein